MRRTWASLFAAGALVCGCGDAGTPRRAAARPPADPLATMDAAHAVGVANLYPVMRHSNAVMTAVGRDVHAALAGDMSVDQALRQLSRDINATLARPGATT